MKKTVSSVDDILAALPAVQAAVQRQIENRIDAGENIVFSADSKVFDNSGMRKDLTTRRRAAISALTTKGVRHKSAA